MQLPIAPSSHEPAAATLVRAARRAAAILARAIAGETGAVDGAQVFHSEAYPWAPDANGALDVTLPAGVEPAAQVAAIDAALPAGHAKRAWCSDEPWPAGLDRAFVDAGWSPRPRTVMILRAYREPSPTTAGLQVIPARSAYTDYRRLHEETPVAEQPTGASPKDWAASRIDLLDESRLDVFLGRLDRVPVGAAGVLTLGNQGVVTGMFTSPAHRRRGVARTLLGWVIDHCRRAQFEQVLADLPGDALGATSLLRSLGFATVASYVGFEKASDREGMA